jgi:hypothetical protein
MWLFYNFLVDYYLIILKNLYRYETNRNACLMPNIIHANNMNFHGFFYESVSVNQLYFVCIYTGIHFGHHQLKEEFAEGVIRIRKSKDRQHNDEKREHKRTYNDLQNIPIKLKIE